MWCQAALFLQSELRQPNPLRRTGNHYEYLKLPHIFFFFLFWTLKITDSAGSSIQALYTQHYSVREWLRLEGTLKPIEFQPSWCGLVAQGPIQPGLECLQRWSIHSFSGQPAPVPHHQPYWIYLVFCHLTKEWNKEKNGLLVDRHPLKWGERQTHPPPSKSHWPSLCPSLIQLSSITDCSPKTRKSHKVSTRVLTTSCSPRCHHTSSSYGHSAWALMVSGLLG